MAFTSHLAQLASTALAATVAEQAGDHLSVAGPGLADTTRLALSPFELWRDILATNSSSIEQALTAYIIKLEHLRDNLRTREIELLRYLARNPGRAISRDEILTNVWRLPSNNVRTRTIDMSPMRMKYM